MQVKTGAAARRPFMLLVPKPKRTPNPARAGAAGIFPAFSPGKTPTVPRRKRGAHGRALAVAVRVQARRAFLVGWRWGGRGAYDFPLRSARSHPGFFWCWVMHVFENAGVVVAVGGG